MKTLFFNNLFFTTLTITILLLILFSKNNLAFAENRISEICEGGSKKACGNKTSIITFPFYIKGVQDPSCGYPGFELSCDEEDRLILNLSGENYIVHGIFYGNESLLVTNAAFTLPNGRCIPSVRNLSLPDHFSVHPSQRQAFFIYDCSSHKASSSSIGKKYLGYTIGCSAKDASRSVLALPEEKRSLVSDVLEKCGTRTVVAVPVSGYQSETGMVGKDELAKGFALRWTANYRCSHCRGANGTCGLFGYDGSRIKCFGADHQPQDNPHDFSGKSGSVALIPAVPIAVAVAGISLILGIFVYCLRKKSPDNASMFFWKRHNQTNQNVEDLLRNYGPIHVTRFSYGDVKKITRRFSEKLGQGGFGDVYKGELQDSCLVAVKVWNQTKGEYGEEFVNEVATISRTSHVNIVKLMGFCFEGAKRALIYEFMPNGSLEKFICNENDNKINDNNNNLQLDWETHYQIAIGIARGLEYLHRGCNTRILHFDIKPHNILLDADFVPKISDFGLAKICAKRESSVSVLGPRGTIGYIAPEVFSRNFGSVSYKSDVYSYGIMILEMVGGRKNLDVRTGYTSEIYFPRWIYKRLELNEDHLGLMRIENEEDRVRAKKMVMVSLWCIQTDPSHRPTMSEVIEMLEGSLNSLQVPPKPFLSSPSTISSPTTSSSMF